VELVQQVGVGGEARQVALHDLQRQASVGDDGVPVAHQVVLGHRREQRELLLDEGLRVDPGEALAVPWGRHQRHPLAAWLAEPTSEVPQIRSLAMLKLYFGQFAHPEDLVALARAQQAMHREQQEFLGAMLERLRARDRPWQLAVGKLMRDAERAMADNWAQVERTVEDAADRERRSSA